MTTKTNEPNLELFSKRVLSLCFTCFWDYVKCRLTTDCRLLFSGLKTMRLVISRSHLHNQNNSSQPSFYADRILWPIIESAYVKGIEKCLLCKKIFHVLRFYILNNSCYPAFLPITRFLMKHQLRIRKHYGRVAVYLN